VQSQAIHRLRGLFGESGQTQRVQAHASGLAAVRHGPPDGIGKTGFQRQMTIVYAGSGCSHGIRCGGFGIQIVDQCQQFLRSLPFNLARQATAAGKKVMQLRQAQAVGFCYFRYGGSSRQLRQGEQAGRKQMAAGQHFQQGLAEGLGGVVMRHQDQAAGKVRCAPAFVLEKNFGSGNQGAGHERIVPAPAGK
jgi:hypothetical protein